MPEANAPQAKPFGQTKTGRGATWVAIAAMAVSGYEGIRTVAYKDPVGIPTICFGETEGIKMGMVKTIPECKELLIDSLMTAYNTLERCAGKDVVDRMPDKPKAAYVSFIFNVGPGGKNKDGFCQLKNGNPSSMLRYLKAGAYTQSCNEFPKWATAKGIPLPGLKKRRAEEMSFCLTGVPDWKSSASSPPVLYWLASLPSTYTLSVALS